MNMKQLSFLMLLSTLILISCGKEELSESIIGTWELKTVSATGCDDATENMAETETDGSGCINILPLSSTYCNLQLTFGMDSMVTSSFVEDGDFEMVETKYLIDEEANSVLVCDDLDDREECEVFMVNGNSMEIVIEEDGCDLVYKFEK